MIWILLGVGYLVGMGASTYLMIVLDDNAKPDTGEGFVSMIFLWPVMMPIMLSMHLAFRAVDRRDKRRALKEAEEREIARTLKEHNL